MPKNKANVAELVGKQVSVKAGSEVYIGKKHVKTLDKKTTVKVIDVKPSGRGHRVVFGADGRSVKLTAVE